MRRWEGGKGGDFCNRCARGSNRGEVSGLLDFFWFVFCSVLLGLFREKADFQEFIFVEDMVAESLVGFLWGASCYRLPIGRSGVHRRL